MLNLALTTDKLQLVTTSAADVHCHVSFVDIETTGVQTPGKQNTAITTATTTDICAAPSGTLVRNVKFISIRNIDAAVTQTVELLFDANATDYQPMPVITLLAGEAWVIREGTPYHLDSNGGVYGVGQTLASQADMETATSLTLTVAAGTQHYHPGHPKCWCAAGITGNILASYNITSVTDTGTGVLTITIANDFSGTAWNALGTIELASTTLCQSCTTDSRAAGSIVLRSVVEAGSSADPVSWAFGGSGDL